MRKDDYFENRRKFKRIRYDGQVGLAFTEENIDHCQAKNLSLTGIFVNGNHFQQSDENCLVKFMIGDEPEKIGMEAEAKIVWGNNNGVALKFTSMKFTSYKLLQKTLMAKAKEPLELLKEFPILAPFDITIV